MKKIATIIAGAALATCAYGENVPVPKHFPFIMPHVPMGQTTSWTLEGNQGKVVKKGKQHVCMFMTNVEAPAYLSYDPYDGTPEWECPRVTVRHLREVAMVRTGGKCKGFICKYDYVFPGDQAAITTDEVEYFHNDPSNPWNLSNTVNARLEMNDGVVWESTNRRGLEKLEVICR